MARFCNLCSRSFTSENAFKDHNYRYHQYPKPAPAPSIFYYHPLLNGRKYNHYTYLKAKEIHFEQLHTSEAGINALLQTLAAEKALETGDPEARAIFDNADDLYSHIDALPYGDQSWTTFSLRYSGPVDANSPSWKRHTYIVHTRNPLRVVESMADSTDFLHTWDYVPFEEYTGEDCPTGHQSFHPVYVSAGNIHNEMRRAHRQGVMPLAFLPIPTCAREHLKDNEFRVFRKQLYHATLTQILSPLRAGMTHPHVLRCADGHFRRAIFEIGPFIADYPEQVYLSGVVQGWCPKCHALPHELESAGDPRFRDHTEALLDTFTPAVLWDVFGVDGDVTLFTNHFPRADIHELLTPDLLHQLIKGTFKDHLVTWVGEYIRLTSETEHEAKRLMDEIDRRLAAAPSFPGLRRFPEGRNFSQWTGNDSKALMKLYLSAIAGLVPDKMVQCFAAFLDFCYLARRPAHDTVSLDAMEDALTYFHELRTVFVETGVRPDGFGLPRQHALVHYVLAIRHFGSPNGLCSSITESKHIEAVKKPWRDSNKNQPLEQILRSITRLSKLSAARIEFGRCGLLQGDVHTAALKEIGADVEDKQARIEGVFLAVRDAMDVDGVSAGPSVELSKKPVSKHPIVDFAIKIGQPCLETLIRHFLHSEIYPDVPLDADVPLDEYPDILRAE
ncbi:hypothetical protein TRAPUB_5692 [Trametes pubescens]|uniref:C2H2-type domain-containing protein n=1 Tax=Trametes pubescens TaxID=154538 RepID=A0A1M2V7V4_TRAPU|nr:hypothetical protein TRAPUB_5692 [Trametes pubescens]